MRWQNCIVAEERIHIGSTNTIRPDFVLYKDEIPQVVIEAKKPNNIQTERNKEQLFSYMRQKKVDFGLYIGEEIQLYYDVPTDVELPLLIFTLDYNEENQYGSAFVNLFNFVDFDKNKLADYCNNIIQEIEKKKQMKLEIQQLTSDDGERLCKSLLKSHFVSKGYTDDDVNTILDEIEIAIRRKNDNIPIDKPIKTYYQESAVTTVKNEYGSSYRRKKYSVNGRGAYFKNGYALELVKEYLKDHPFTTYNNIVLIFNGHIPNYVKSEVEVENKERLSSDRNASKRWHIGCPLVSSDGVTFYVTTQVGEGCPIDFNEIVMLSKKLGYDIEPV